MAKSDYISRAAVLNELYRQINATGKYTTYEAALDDVHLFVEKIPAADVVEVRHGRWISVAADVRFRCSLCDCEVSTSWDYDQDGMFDYCPCCGAKMDGERKGGDA